jgi:cell pole-organizing protein PopZ
MSEQTSQEPTMEEILASIRRIISEDDAPASGDAAPGDPPEVAPEAAAAPEPATVEVVPPPAPEPEPEPEPVLDSSEEDEVLELTERVETHGDIDVYTPPPAPDPAPAAPVAAPAASLGADDALVGSVAATAAASAFGKLSAAIAMPRDGNTLEDVVRDLLRPLLKDWLDEHLATIVQSAVAEEVERIARSRMR